MPITSVLVATMTNGLNLRKVSVWHFASLLGANMSFHPDYRTQYSHKKRPSNPEDPVAARNGRWVPQEDVHVGTDVGLRPEKWSALMYGFRPYEGLRYAEKATQAGRDCREAAAG